MAKLKYGKVTIEISITIEISNLNMIGNTLVNNTSFSTRNAAGICRQSAL